MPVPPPSATLPGPYGSLHEMARIFSVASSPIRLQILLSLNAGARSIAELHEGLGGDRRLIHQHLDALGQGHLVGSHRTGKTRLFHLTEDGERLIRAMGVVSPPFDGHKSSLPCPSSPAPELTRSAVDAAGTNSLPDLVGLLKAFADPVRLRLLNLLTGYPREVCVCHLREALDLPQSTVSRHLTSLKQAGLIAGRKKGTWVYYRLVHAANDLGRILAARLEEVSGIDDFLDDRRRLAGLEACTSPGDDKRRV